MSRTHRLVVAVAAAGLLAAACGGPRQDGTTRATPVFTPAAGRAPAAGPAGPASPSSSPSVSPSASARASTPGPTPLASIGTGERAVSVLALNGYVEWGGTDPKVSWVGEFEKTTGCKVGLRFYDPSRDDGASVPAPSSFDVISATPVIAGGLIAEGKVAPLNTALLPGYDKIPKRLRELPAEDGQVYGVPYLWGLNQVLYDSGEVDPDGADAIFADEGPVMFRDSPLSLADAALVLKERGARVKDPFHLTPEQLDAAAELFDKPDRRLFWTDPIEVVKGFAAGSVRLAQGTPYHRDVLSRGDRPVRAAGDRPVTGWADSWMVSARAAHPSCAYRWLDWTSSAAVQRQVAAWTGSAPANPGACTGRARRVCAAYRMGEPDAFRGVYFAERPTDYDQWIGRWSQIAG
ncbi:extracellular solute-binding protein [Sphaerimonospora mesophila]|uniref:extracellular solute-binding protein n=1 Tax=Sphaerimonospora mesophila TaxID=37483 RepID=UPI0006E11F4D